MAKAATGRIQAEAKTGNAYDKTPSGDNFAQDPEPTVEICSAKEGNIWTAWFAHGVYTVEPEPASIRREGNVEEDSDNARKMAEVADSVPRKTRQRAKKEVLSYKSAHNA